MRWFWRIFAIVSIAAVVICIYMFVTVIRLSSQIDDLWSLYHAESNKVAAEAIKDEAIVLENSLVLTHPIIIILIGAFGFIASTVAYFVIRINYCDNIFDIILKWICFIFSIPWTVALLFFTPLGATEIKVRIKWRE